VLFLGAQLYLKYNEISTSFFDLGIFINQSFTYDNSDYYRFIYGHTHMYSFINNFLYQYIRLPLLLLTQQIVVILFSLYFIKKLTNNYKYIYMIVFLLSYSVWYNVLFDFHYDYLSILFMMAFYYFIKEQKYKSAFFIGVLVAFIKEPFALVMSFMGLYMIVKSKQYLKGSLLFIYGFLYFYVATHYVIPFVTPDYGVIGSGAANFEVGSSFGTDGSFGAGGSLLDICLYPITHFKEFIIDIITTKKIVYLVALFTAFGLVVVFFSPLELIPAIPSLGIAMLSNIENYYWYNTHYTAPLIAPFMVAFIYGFPKFIKFCNKYVRYIDTENKILLVVFIPIVFSHIIFSPSPFSRFFWINKLPQYHYSAYIPTARTVMIKKAILKYIPKDENISVASQNSLNWGHLAHRKYYFAFPQGVVKETDMVYLDSDSFIKIIDHLIRQDKSIVKNKKIRTDFVAIDMKRPLYLIDKSVTKDEFMEVIVKMKNDYKVIYEYDRFFIYKRKNLNEYIKNNNNN
jgi:uncharacterized membrane protein